MVFIETSLFTRKLDSFLGNAAPELLSRLQQHLLDDPERGDIVPGLAGVRKVRLANPGRGKGKRGGFRCLYLYLRKKDQIFLLNMLDKNEQIDLTPAERKVLATLARELKGSE